MGFKRLVELLLFIFVCKQFYHQEPIPRKPQLYTLGFTFFPILLINIDGPQNTPVGFGNALVLHWES